MNKELLSHVISNHEVYQFISEQPRTEEEITQFFLKDLKKGDTTTRNFVRAIKNTRNGIIVGVDDVFTIDKAKAQVAVDELIDVLALPHENEEISRIAEELSRLESENESLKDAYEKLKIQEQDLSAELKTTGDKLEEAINAAPRMVFQSMTQKVFIPDSIAIGPMSNPNECIFMEDIRVEVDPDPMPLEVKGEKKSFYEDIPEAIKVDEDNEVGNELTEENYHKKSVIKWIKDNLLKRRIQENEIVKTVEVEDTVCEPSLEVVRNDAEADELFESFRRSQRKLIQSIADNPKMTNQEKLALYAFYSEHHGKDMEKLLNFAGDNCINARLLIQLLESKGRACKYENIRDMLRQFCKASEYRLKYDFAKELINGSWYITAEYNGHITKFQLVPLEEFNELRAAVGLPVSEFCYQGDKKVAKDEAKEESNTSSVSRTPLGPHGFDRFNIADGIEFNPPDIPHEDFGQSEKENE